MAQGKSKIDFEPSQLPYDLPLADQDPVVEADELPQDIPEIVDDEVPEEVIPVLDTPLEESEEDNEVSIEEDDVAPVITLYSADKPTKKAKKPVLRLPAGSFFSINFKKTQDGSIAIANSFSTGNKGRAESRSISYGSPRH